MVFIIREIAGSVASLTTLTGSMHCPPSPSEIGECTDEKSLEF